MEWIVGILACLGVMLVALVICIAISCRADGYFIRGKREGEREVRAHIMSELVVDGYFGPCEPSGSVAHVIGYWRDKYRGVADSEQNWKKSGLEFEKRNIELNREIGSLKAKLESKEMVAIADYDQKIERLKKDLKDAEIQCDLWKNRALSFEHQEAYTAKHKKAKR